MRGKIASPLLTFAPGNASAPGDGAKLRFFAGNAELNEHLVRRGGQVRNQQYANDAEALRKVVQNGLEPLLAVVRFGERPGGGDVDVFIAGADELPNFGQRVGNVQVGHLRVHTGGQVLCQRNQRRILVAGNARRGQHAAEILVDHGDRAAQQVPEVVCKVRVDAGDERFVGEVAVRTEGYFAQQEIADGVHAVAFAECNGIDHVALALTHLAAVEHEPAVAEHLLGERPRRAPMSMIGQMMV